jgi:hypothetical protein
MVRIDVTERSVAVKLRSRTNLIRLVRIVLDSSQHADQIARARLNVHAHKPHGPEHSASDHPRRSHAHERVTTSIATFAAMTNHLGRLYD